MLRLALDGMTAFSDAPLMLATVSGFLVSGVAFLLIGYTFYARFITHDYQSGWASVMVSILFLGGVHLVAVGIIGEYISCPAADVRRRPFYLVSDTNIPPPASLKRLPARARRPLAIVARGLPTMARPQRLPDGDPLHPPLAPGTARAAPDKIITPPQPSVAVPAR